MVAGIPGGKRLGEAGARRRTSYPATTRSLSSWAGERRLVVERAQVEVKGAVADAADHGNRQAAEGGGQAIEALAAHRDRERRQQVDRQGARADLAAHRLDADRGIAADRLGDDGQQALGLRTDLVGRAGERAHRRQALGEPRRDRRRAAASPRGRRAAPCRGAARASSDCARCARSDGGGRRSARPAGRPEACRRRT